MAIYLSKKVLETEVGKNFLELLIRICEDGVIEQSELEEIQAFLSENEKELPEENPSVEILQEFIKDILSDGKVEDYEYELLLETCLKIIPKRNRDVILLKIRKLKKKAKIEEKQRREEQRILEERRNYPPTRKQFRYLESLGAEAEHVEQLKDCSRYEVSNYIDEFLAIRGPGPTNRQSMLLKFWGQDLAKFKTMELDDISDWIDDWVWNGDYRKEAWDKFKVDHPAAAAETGPNGVDLVEHGIGFKYEKKITNQYHGQIGNSSGSGCLVIILGLAGTLLSIAIVLYMLI